jgi:hypothetical protein
MTFGETPWVDRNYRALHEALQRRVPAEWLPRTISERTVHGTVGFDPPRPFTEVVKFKRPVIEEYGCGHYGCVAPTHEPGLVFKLTTDASEAAFVARAMTLPETAGIVGYKKIYSTGLKHRGKSLFVLWRTEATSVGAWSFAKRHPDVYGKQVQREADTLLQTFLMWAKIVREYVYPKLRSLQTSYADPPEDLVAERTKLLAELWKSYEREEPVVEHSIGSLQSLKGLRRVGVALRTCLYVSQEMSGNAALYRVGQALGHYLEEGILLADVHGNNIGLDDGEAIITDPGHAVEFHPRWAQPPQVERL